MASVSDRRGFLKSAGLLSLAAAARGWPEGGRALAAMRPLRRVGGPYLKVALNAYSFSKLLNDQLKGRAAGVSLIELVDFCARQGFDGFDATGYFFPGYPAPPPDAYVNALKRRAFELGVGISGTGVRNHFTTADKAVRAASVEHVKQWVEVAARLGAPVLRVFADTQMKDQTWETVAPGSLRDEVERWIADNLRECAEHGEKFGVIIGVQNHGDFLKTSENQLSLVKRVDSDWCGPIVDTGYYRSDDPYKDIAAVAPYAVNWQIKESPVGAGSEVRMDLKRLFTLVRLAGYRGYLPIETLSARGQDYDPFVVAPRFLAEVRQALEATANIAPPPEADEPPAAAPRAGESPAGERGANPSGDRPPDPRPARKPANKNKGKTPTDP